MQMVTYSHFIIFTLKNVIIFYNEKRVHFQINVFCIKAADANSGFIPVFTMALY